MDKLYAVAAPPAASAAAAPAATASPAQASVAEAQPEPQPAAPAAQAADPPAATPEESTKPAPDPPAPSLLEAVLKGNKALLSPEVRCQTFSKAGGRGRGRGLLCTYMLVHYNMHASERLLRACRFEGSGCGLQGSSPACRLAVHASGSGYGGLTWKVVMSCAVHICARECFHPEGAASFDGSALQAPAAACSHVVPWCRGTSDHTTSRAGAGCSGAAAAAGPGPHLCGLARTRCAPCHLPAVPALPLSTHGLDLPKTSVVASPCVCARQPWVV